VSIAFGKGEAASDRGYDEDKLGDDDGKEFRRLLSPLRYIRANTGEIRFLSRPFQAPERLISTAEYSLIWETYSKKCSAESKLEEVFL
jgi:hypothetical protein